MSFRLKTILGIAAIEAVLLGILVLSALGWLHDSNEEQLIQRAETTVRLFASTAKDAVLSTDLASLESLVRLGTLDTPGMVYTRVRGEDGEVLAEAGDEAALARSFAPDADPSRVPDGVFDVYAEIREGAASFGRVELGLSVEAFHRVLHDARSGAVGIALLEMLLVALFSLALGTYLTRQLNRLRDASARIGREGPGFLIPVKGSDEIAQAIRAFNAMSSGLADSYAAQRRVAEEARAAAGRMQASEAQKAAVLEAALDAIVTIDQDGRVLEYNRSAEAIFGYGRDEVIGRELHGIIIPTRHREAHRQGMERYRESGIGRILGKRLELHALHKSGAEVPVEIAITEVATDHGTGFTAFMRDISERKRAEEELRLAAYAFEAQEAIFITDRDARILRVNRAFSEMTGYGEDEAIGQTPRILNSGRQDADFYRRMWASLLGEGYWEGEIENRRKDGETYPEWLSITAVRDAEGQTTHYVAHFTDISEQKRNQAALEAAAVRAEQASEAKSRFLATMSHEIRTPLNAIINMNDLLLESDLDSDQLSYAVTASEAGRNLLSIVNGILDFSKIEAGRMEQHPEPCDAEEVAGGVLRLLAPRAYGKGIELTLFADPELPRRFKTDPGLLRQILLNLIGNAIKFTETGGVRVRLGFQPADPAGPQVLFEVIDTGIGIPKDKLAELFTEFTQVDGSYSRRFGGTGLGLAISRALAHNLGGDVGCESEPGQGSRFWLRLPAVDAEAAVPPPGELARLLGRRPILIQSVNSILAQELNRQLVALGLNARTLGDLRGAPEWLADSRCAGVIALCEGGAACSDDRLPTSEQARLIGLFQGVGRDREQGLFAAARVPLVPTALYQVLRRAAGGKMPEAPAAGAPPSRTEVAGGGEPKPPILLVDDSEPNRLVAKALLARAGYEVETAENGLQAVAAVKEKDYGLVLMDVAMPEMDGLEATRTIRALAGERARVPIVAMTAGAFPEDKQRCLDAGMNDHVSKPVVRADLLRAVDRWLRGSVQRTRPAGEPEPEPPQVLLDDAVLAELEGEVTAELFPAMVDAFVAEVQRRLPIIERAAGGRDMRSVGEEAHALKGVAGTFGATALQARALELEKAAREDRADRVVDRVPALMTVARDTLAAMANRFGGGDRDPGAPSAS